MPHIWLVGWAPAGLDVTWGSLSDFEQFPVELLKVLYCFIHVCKMLTGTCKQSCKQSRTDFVYPCTHLQNLLCRLCTVSFKDKHMVVNLTPVSWWLETNGVSKTFVFSNSLPQWSTSLVATRRTDVKRWWNCYNEKKQQQINKMVPAFIAPGAKKLNAPEDCSTHQLFFMMQTHLEVCTESFSSEGIMFSLTALGWTTASPTARLQDDLTSAFPKFKMSWTSLVVPESRHTSHQPELVPSRIQLHDPCGLETMSLKWHHLLPNICYNILMRSNIHVEL